MRIINPIYDQAFKYLMENKPIAKKILSVIIEEEIIDLEISMQETTIEDPARYLRILRMDFKARIQTTAKEYKTVLIELQKCEHPTDIIRFRKYLGKSYFEVKENKEGEKEVLPIIAIYILGYNIPDIDTPGIIVDKVITDAINKKPLKIKSEFIELLNHKTHIIQLNRLRKERKTRLEKMLSLFDQSRKTEDKYVLEVEADNEFRDIAEHLQKPVADEEFRRKLDLQEEVDMMFGPVETELILVKEKLLEKDKTIEENKKALEEKDKALEEQKYLIKELMKKIEEKK